jgi:hypothetical protein
LRKNQESNRQVLELEIKKIEKEIDQLLTDEQKELVKEFIKVNQKAIKNKEDKIARNNAEESEEKLKKKLKETNFSKEDIKKVIHRCEKLVDSEQKVVREKLETNVEITNK